MNKAKTFNQLSEQERSQIEVLLKAGKSKAEIARLTGRHISTIYREVNRNTAKRGKDANVYKAVNAQLKAVTRHKQKPKSIRFTDELKCQVYRQITEDKLSPELIAGSMKQKKQECVSHETIYKWIWQHNRGCIQQRVSIEKRPKVIAERKRIGDKEMDIVLGKNHKPGLLVLHDRKTRMTWLEKIESKAADYIESKIKKLLKRCKHHVRSITTDNDLAFANHYKLGVKVYFTRPYSSFEKGSVENRIGVLRRFFPKKTDFTTVSKKEIEAVEEKLNKRPMKKFNFETPWQQYFKFAFIS